MAERSPGGEPDGEGQLIERRRKPVLNRYFSDDVVVATAEILDESIPGSKDPR